ncbi:MAG: STAS domain-containing protein [Myxococcota bacterium]|nr:STAS domain-containing protein [Myxococcota bacterium]
MVEPSLTQRLWLRALLGGAGCQVTAVTSVESAQARYEKAPHCYDTVLIASEGRPGGQRSEDRFPWHTPGSMVHAIDRERSAEGVYRVRQRGAADPPARPRTAAEAQIVRIAGQRFALPLCAVVEGRMASRERIVSLVGGRAVFEFRGSKVVVDMQGIDYMDSSALGVMLLLREYVGEDDADVRLINGRPEIRNILQVSNFEQLFKIE